MIWAFEVDSLHDDFAQTLFQPRTGARTAATSNGQYDIFHCHPISSAKAEMDMLVENTLAIIAAII